MKALILILLFTLIGCSVDEPRCYQCIEIKYSQSQQSEVCDYDINLFIKEIEAQGYKIECTPKQ